MGCYGPIAPVDVQDRGSQASRLLVDDEVGAKPGTVVVVVAGGVVVVVVPCVLDGLVVVVEAGVGAGAAMEKCVPVITVTGFVLVGSKARMA